MKKIFSLTTLLLLAIVLVISSCAKEENDPTPIGSYAGTWQLNETSVDFGPSTYSVVISDTASNLQFAYLYGFTQKTYVLVSGNNITIPVQTIQGNNISGVGTLTTTTRIDLTYIVQSTATHYDTVFAVLNKF